MATPEKKIKGKYDTPKEVARWVFDIAFLGGLIWFFAGPGHTEAFWSGISSKIHEGISFVIRKVGPALPHNTAPATPPVVAKKYAPPPLFIPPPLPTPEQLAAEQQGDCAPPEVRSPADAAATEHLDYDPTPAPKTAIARKAQGKPVAFAKKKIKGVPYYQVTIDLRDPDSYLVIRLPHDASEANSVTFTRGHEEFNSFVKRYRAAVVANGTFFSKDEQERVMGNMVSDGRSLRYSQWENYGTTLGLREGNYPEMVTARDEGKPDWDSHWFSLTCGPRLLKRGQVWLNPELEGFTDPHVLGIGPRCAIGFPKSRDQLYLISFLRGLSLKQEAALMKEIGCYEAMNLDGGASKALSHDTSIVMSPGRGLTNVLVVYDSKHKAPKEVVASWEQFQKAHGNGGGFQ
jgi:hypothetical protein